jgi:hypothetical protein
MAYGAGGMRGPGDAGMAKYWDASVLCRLAARENPPLRLVRAAPGAPARLELSPR